MTAHHTPPPDFDAMNADDLREWLKRNSARPEPSDDYTAADLRHLCRDAAREYFDFETFWHTVNQTIGRAAAWEAWKARAALPTEGQATEAESEAAE